MLYVIAFRRAHHSDRPWEQANIQENALSKECIHAPFKLHDYLKTKSQKLWKRKKLCRQRYSCNSSPHTYFILAGQLVPLHVVWQRRAKNSPRDGVTNARAQFSKSSSVWLWCVCIDAIRCQEKTEERMRTLQSVSGYFCLKSSKL